MPPSSPDTPAKAGWRSIVLWGLVAAAVLGALWFFLLRNTQPEPPSGPNQWAAPVAVRISPIEHSDFTVQAQSIGTVTPSNAVTVRSRVAGTLLKVHVAEGQTVRAGQLLAEIDPKPYEVALAQARGQQQQNQAQLKNAKSELARYRQLFEQDSIARLQLERQEALVQQLEGTQLADQAQVDEAKLQLSYARITAPIGGQVGMRRVDAGNLIAANDTNGLFTIVQTQPIQVQFTVPEAQVAAVRAAQRGENGGAEVQAWDRENRQLLAHGVLDSIDNQIDISTGTLRIKARFDNTDDALFPNQFVNVRLDLSHLNNATTIPTDAIQHGSIGSYVYVVEDGKSHVRVLELGPSSGGRTVVVKGLDGASSVVLEGLDRLREGRDVLVVADKQALAPEIEEASAPAALTTQSPTTNTP